MSGPWSKSLYLQVENSTYQLYFILVPGTTHELTFQYLRRYCHPDKKLVMLKQVC